MIIQAMTCVSVIAMLAIIVWFCIETGKEINELEEQAHRTDLRMKRWREKCKRNRIKIKRRTTDEEILGRRDKH